MRLVAVLAGSGRVVRLRPDRPGSPDAGQLVPGRLSVESAWRYLWLFRQEAGHYDDETDDVLDAFLARLQELDPAIGDDPGTVLLAVRREHW